MILDPDHDAGLVVDEAQPIQSPEPTAAEMDRGDLGLQSSLRPQRHPGGVVAAGDLQVWVVSASADQHDGIAALHGCPGIAWIAVLVGAVHLRAHDVLNRCPGFESAAIATDIVARCRIDIELGAFEGVFAGTVAHDRSSAHRAAPSPQVARAEAVFEDQIRCLSPCRQTTDQQEYEAKTNCKANRLHSRTP